MLRSTWSLGRRKVPLLLGVMLTFIVLAGAGANLALAGPGTLVDNGFESGTDGQSLVPPWVLSGAPQKAEYDNARAKVGTMSGLIQGPTTAAYAGVSNAQTSGMNTDGAELRFWAYLDTANQNRVITDGGCVELRWNTAGQLMVYTK